MVYLVISYLLLELLDSILLLLEQVFKVLYCQDFPPLSPSLFWSSDLLPTYSKVLIVLRTSSMIPLRWLLIGPSIGRLGSSSVFQLYMGARKKAG